MGMRMTLFKAAITGRTQSVAGFFTRGYSEPPDRNTAEWLRTFGTSPRMAVVNKIATDLASVGGKLYRYNAEGKREEVLDHPFIDLMDTVNPLNEVTRSAFWRVMEIWGMIKGEQVAVIERGRDGTPAELWPVPPHWVAEVPKADKPYYLIRSKEGLQREIPIEDIFVIRDLDPLDPYGRGLGIAEALADEVETDEYMAKYAKAFFYNGATPPTIISAPGMTEGELKRFEVGWSEKYAGARNAHKLGILNRAASILRASDTAKEMDFVVSRSAIRDMCIAHFGVPPEIMGVVENSNRASITQAKIIYAENVQQPRLTARQDALNQQLLIYWGDDYYYEFDNIVPQDEEFKLQKSDEGLSRGALLLNEWRKENGYDEVPWGNVLMVPAAVIPLRPEELVPTLPASAPPSPPAPTSPAPVDGATPARQGVGSEPLSQSAEEVRVASEVSLNGAQISSLLQIVAAVNLGELSYNSAVEIITSSFPFDTDRARKILGDPPNEQQAFSARDVSAASLVKTKARTSRRMNAVRTLSERALQAQERAAEPQIRRYFAEQLRRIMDAMQHRQKADDGSWLSGVIKMALPLLANSDEAREAIMEALSSLIDWEAEAVRLEAILSPVWQSGLTAGAGIAEAIGIHAVRAPELTARMRSRGLERLDEIAETTRGHLAASLTNGIEAGESTAQLVKRIQEHMPEIQDGRARVIATTEAHTSIMEGNVEQLRMAGIAEKVWVTAGDADVRDTHRDINGERRPIDEPFSNGLQFPGDPAGPPGEIINCRCTIMPGELI